MNGFPYAFFGLLPDGTTGQVLKKKTNASYDVEWGTIDSGLFGESYTLVKANSADPLVNGASLVAAYTAAKALTPYGAALSSTNRYTILLGDGIYSFGATFTVDTEFIDFKSLSGNLVTFNNNVSIEADDLYFSGIDAGANTIQQTATYPNLIVKNCKSTAEYSFSILDFSAIGSTFIDCVGGDYSFGGQGVFSGTATNCIGGDYSFGGAGGEFSGTATNCVGGAYSFGGQGVFSGTATNCIGGDYSFGADGGLFSGTATNCIGGDYSFGYASTLSGKVTNCTGGSQSFAGAGGVFSGTATNCIGGPQSFGWGGTLSGKLYFCKSGGLYQTVSGGGRTYYCIDGSNSTNNQ